MRFSLTVFVIAIFFLTLSFLNFSYSASTPFSRVRSGKTPINITADSMTYDKDTGIYTAQGNVEIHQLDQVLRADTVEFENQTQMARAEGNVVYTTEDGDSLECETLEMNLETKEGVVSGGKLFYKKENVYLKGRQIEKLGENRFRLVDGDITTCNGKRPSWKFKCKEADVTLEGLAKVKGATFRIKDYPVLYFFLLP